MSILIRQKNGKAADVERAGERAHSVYKPLVDLVEREHELVLVADMPGVTADAIDVRYENGLLTIHGRIGEREVPDSRTMLREYGAGDFQRSFRLSDVIDTQGIRAESSDGVLTVHLPKVAQAQPRRIEVRPA